MTLTLPYAFGTGTTLDKLFLSQLQDDLDAIVAEINTNQGDLQAEIDALQADVSTLQTQVTADLVVDFVSGIIASPQNKDYRIIEKIPYGATLNSFTGKTSSGTLTAALTINGTAVTTGSLNVTSTQGTVSPTALNVAASGAYVSITISAISSPVDFSFTLKFTRALA